MKKKLLFKRTYVLLIALFGTLNSFAATYTYLVNTLGDGNTGSGNNGTLRYVFNQININGTNADAHIVNFSSGLAAASNPATGAARIVLTSPLPVIYKSNVTIDGFITGKSTRAAFTANNNRQLAIEISADYNQFGNTGLENQNGTYDVNNMSMLTFNNGSATISNFVIKDIAFIRSARSIGFSYSSVIRFGRNISGVKIQGCNFGLFADGTYSSDLTTGSEIGGYSIFFGEYRLNTGPSSVFLGVEGPLSASDVKIGVDIASVNAADGNAFAGVNPYHASQSGKNYKDIETGTIVIVGNTTPSPSNIFIKGNVFGLDKARTGVGSSLAQTPGMGIGVLVTGPTSSILQSIGKIEIGSGGSSASSAFEANIFNTTATAADQGSLRNEVAVEAGSVTFRDVRMLTTDTRISGNYFGFDPGSNKAIKSNLGISVYNCEDNAGTPFVIGTKPTDNNMAHTRNIFGGLRAAKYKYYFGRSASSGFSGNYIGLAPDGVTINNVFEDNFSAATAYIQGDVSNDFLPKKVGEGLADKSDASLQIEYCQNVNVTGNVFAGIGNYKFTTLKTPAILVSGLVKAAIRLKLNAGSVAYSNAIKGNLFGTDATGTTLKPCYLENYIIAERELAGTPYPSSVNTLNYVNIGGNRNNSSERNVFVALYSRYEGTSPLTGGTAIRIMNVNARIRGNYIGVLPADLSNTNAGNDMSGIFVNYARNIDHSNFSDAGSVIGAATDNDPESDGNIIGHNGLGSTHPDAQAITMGLSGVQIAGAVRVKVSRNIFFNNKANAIGFGGSVSGAEVTAASNLIWVNKGEFNDPGTYNTNYTGLTIANYRAIKPNNGINYPVFTNVKYNNTTKQLTVSGYIGNSFNNTKANSAIQGEAAPYSYRVEVYKGTSDNNSATYEYDFLTQRDGTNKATHKEGNIYLGYITTTDGRFCDATINYTGRTDLQGNPVSLSNLDEITGIAIDGAGNTSQFGALAPVIGDYGDLGAAYTTTQAFGKRYGCLTDIIISNSNALTIPDNLIFAGTRISFETANYTACDNYLDPGGASCDIDDGIVFIEPFFKNRSTQVKLIANSNKPNTTVYYRLWIDWNGDGVFNDLDPEDGEGGKATYSGTMVTSSPVEKIIMVTPPENITATTNAAFRYAVSSQPIPYNAINSGIITTDGEVEDWMVPTGTVVLSASDLNLSGIYLNGEGHLSWETSTETNSKYFSIERSIDGVTYTKIGQADAAGYSNALRNYSFVDKTKPSGIVYYRVILISADGKRLFSKVIALGENNEVKITIFPNPAKSNLTIRGLSGNTEIRVLGLDGKLVFKTNTINEAVKNVNVSALSSGTYLIKVYKSQVEVYASKFVKH